MYYVGLIYTMAHALAYNVISIFYMSPFMTYRSYYLSYNWIGPDIVVEYV